MAKMSTNYAELDKLIKEYLTLISSHPKIWKPGDIRRETETAYRLSFTESDPVAVINYKLSWSKQHAQEAQ